jgi:hypothetical protein
LDAEDEEIYGMLSDVFKDSIVSAAYRHKGFRIAQFFCLLRDKAIDSIKEAVLEIG